MLRPDLCCVRSYNCGEPEHCGHCSRNIIRRLGSEPFVQWRLAMDQTIYFIPLTVPHRDDAPFTDERYRYLRHCAEAGATAASLKLKRNELLRIAAYLGSDASEGIDIEALQRIATERLRRTGAVTAARRVVDIGR